MTKKKEYKVGETRCLFNPRTKKEHLQKFTGKKPFAWKFIADDKGQCNRRKK